MQKHKLANVEYLINQLENLKKYGSIPCGYFRTIENVIAILRTHPDAQPNEPLTEKELRKMAGRPVWLRRSNGSVECAVVDPDRPYLWRVGGETLYFPDAEIMKIAYRYPPRQIQDDRL